MSILRPKLAQILRRPVPSGVVVLADVVGIAVIGLFLVGLVDRNFRTQCDLQVYKYAGKAVLQGIDPYVRENLKLASGGRPVFPFLYPPITLLPCLAIANVPWLQLASTWIWIKIGILGVLIAFWARWPVRQPMVLPMALLAVFGWNATAQKDLVCGNVAILEATLVWIGLGSYVAGRRGVFAALVVTAALFKLAPAAFLLLLLVPDTAGCRSWRLLSAAGGALGVLVVGPMLV